MGAALGMILGLGAGALKNYGEQKAREHLMEKQMEVQNEAAAKRAQMSTFINMATTGQLPNTPGVQKEITKAFGGDKDAVDMFMGVNQLAQQRMKMFQAQMGSAGGGPAPGAGGGLHFNGKTDPQSLLEMRGRLANFVNDPNPMIANAAKAHIQQIDAQLKQSNADQRAAQQQQVHADTLGMERARLAEAQQAHADMVGLREQTTKFMEQMQSAREKDEQQAHFQSAVQNIHSMTGQIAKMLTGASPSDPQTVKSLLDQRNATARRLMRIAKAKGIDFDAAELAPLTMKDVPSWWQKHTGGLVGGSTSTLVPDTTGADGGGAADSLEAARKALGL
jgi:hypothetical protein